jgi:hypothetical protein
MYDDMWSVQISTMHDVSLLEPVLHKRFEKVKAKIIATRYLVIHVRVQ